MDNQNTRRRGPRNIRCCVVLILVLMDNQNTYVGEEVEVTYEVLILVLMDNQNTYGIVS